MDKLSVKEIADFIGGELIGDNLYIDKITTDSRESAPGALFVGIKGERVDGNDFAGDFLKNGGSCVVVEKTVEAQMGKAVISVADTKKAIRDIAEFYRTRLKTDVVAVTGSVGKTSTKEMLASVLSKAFNTFATKGNFNNEIGVPLTLFSLDSRCEKAVIEMGMNNPGEISRLTKIAKPHVAVITNIGTAHIGNLGSRENILKAKLEILECLDKNGIAVLNGDDDYLWGANGNIKHKTLYYAIENKDADLVAYNVVCDEGGSSFKLKLDGVEYSFFVPVVGVHHIYNALAAIICGLHFNMSAEDIIKGVAEYKTTGMRQNIIEAGGVKLIEDCYNASLDSMKSSLDVLSTLSQGSRGIAVLGDMLEQGEHSKALHNAVGEYAFLKKIHTVVCVGRDAMFIAEKSKELGMENVFAFDNNEKAVEFLKSYAEIGDVVLFKASRGMKLEEASAGLLNFLKGTN